MEIPTGVYPVEQTAIDWLQTAVPRYFFGANFDIERFCLGGDEMLLVRVYGSLSPFVFRKQRHALCREMIERKFIKLYERVSIFQRWTPKLKIIQVIHLGRSTNGRFYNKSNKPKRNC